ncbi:hypothetical protein BMS3Bbin04_01537 [bacterium BMS3Bbin04]|nr:hypothetical protein BMS3Bbin04_01537 [bacterium BMS3Bbin04]
MVNLEPFTESAQDRDSVFDVRRIYLDRLEPSFQRLVLLEMLTVFIQRSCAYAVEFATGEHRLEHVSSIHRAFGFARANDGMELVDEQQDAAFALLDLL